MGRSAAFSKTKKMKRKIGYPFFWVFVVFSLLGSCEKDNTNFNEEMQIEYQKCDAASELYTLGEGVADLTKVNSFKLHVYEQVEKKFDGDFNVLIETVQDDFPSNGLKSAKIQNSLNYFKDGNLFPQIYIPFYEELKSAGKLSQKDPVFLIFTDENESGNYEGYLLNEDGKFSKLKFLVDAKFAMNNEVWVISLNERVDKEGKVIYSETELLNFQKLSTSFNSIGNSTPGILKNASGCANPPAAPTNTQVFPMIPYSINIQWQEVNTALYYKLYREENYSGQNVEIATVSYPQSSYSDNNLTSGAHYDYKVRAFSGDDCYSVSTLGKGAYASWRTNNYFDVLNQIYITDACWNWCCSWPEGDIELKYRIVKYNKTDQVVEYPKNSLPSKSKSSQKGRWCIYDKELFRWDITRYAYNYLLFVYEDDGGDDSGMTIKLTAKFEPTDALTIGAEITFTIDDKDEELGWIEIHHHDIYGKIYNLSPRKGSAQLKVRQWY